MLLHVLLLRVVLLLLLRILLRMRTSTCIQHMHTLSTPAAADGVAALGFMRQETTSSSTL
jgi:hypothetical protein